MEWKKINEKMLYEENESLVNYLYYMGVINNGDWVALEEETEENVNRILKNKLFEVQWTMDIYMKHEKLWRTGSLDNYYTNILSYIYESMNKKVEV